MTKIPQLLKDVATQVADGTPRRETVRTLVSWFGAQRRGTWVTMQIQQALADLKLRTEPDFTINYLDTTVRFISLAEAQKASNKESSGDAARKNDAADPVPRVSLLKAANKDPVTVTRDATIASATTLMIVNDYSQLPVMNGRTLIGLFSWKTYGEAMSLGRPCAFVRDCMDDAPLVLRPDTSLLEAVPQVASRDVALVYEHGTLRGIITTSDLSVEFHASTRPFILLGSIENNIRAIVASFDIETLRQARAPHDTTRVINTPGDLSFGEYLRLFEREDAWSKVAPTLDRTNFVKQLERVRSIRNDVMHFHPDPLAPDEIVTLETTLRALQLLRATPPAR